MEWKEIKISGLLGAGDYGPSSSFATKLLWDLAKSTFLDLDVAQTQTGGVNCWEISWLELGSSSQSSITLFHVQDIPVEGV